MVMIPAETILMAEQEANDRAAARKKDSDAAQARIRELEAECDRWAEASIAEDARRAAWREALERIACRHVTEAPLWWQIEARNALAFTNGVGK